MTLLECEGLDTYYGDSQVLHDTSLSIGPGEHIGVIGRNGMGKSTLVYTIMGIRTSPARPRRRWQPPVSPWCPRAGACSAR